MASCLRDAGWDATVDDNGDIQQSHSVDQDQQYLAAVDDCYATVGMIATHALTDEQFHILYQHELVTRDCLAAQGYPPTGEPPTEQEYVENYYNGGWFAWSVVPDDVSAPEWARLNEVCPQTPEEAKDW